MRILLILFLSTFFSLKIIAQKNDLRKNSVMLEVGFFHRGILGVSYSRNFFIEENQFIATNLFGGMGLYYPAYVGGSLDYNIGNGEVFFFIGSDVKSISESDWKNIFTFSGPWKFAWEPHIGMNIISNHGLSTKLLLGYLFVNEQKGDYFEIPALGLSVGYSF